MVAVAVVGLVLAYAARYFACNSIADRHLRALVSLYQKSPFSRSDAEREMESYHEVNNMRYKRAAIHPWVPVRHRFIPFDEAGRPGTAP